MEKRDAKLRLRLNFTALHGASIRGKWSAERLSVGPFRSARLTLFVYHVLPNNSFCAVTPVTVSLILDHPTLIVSCRDGWKTSLQNICRSI
jgi:hypothetical protein